MLSLHGNVVHNHAIRFASKKIITVTNEQAEEIVYSIELSQDKYSNSEGNETSFFFGGDDKSLFLFSNLTFKSFSNNYNKPINCPRLLFMDIMHSSKLTFLNCKFVNSSDKPYLIRTMHDAIIEFIECNFIGKFEFESIHDSKITRN